MYATPDLELFRDVRRGRRARAAEQVRARRRERKLERLEQIRRERMRRLAQRDRVEPAGDDVGNRRALGQHERQRPRPETLHQRVRLARNVVAQLERGMRANARARSADRTPAGAWSRRS
jgi:hypothetical protein